MQLLQIRFLQIKRELGLWFFIIVGVAIYFSVSFVSNNQKHNLVFLLPIIFGIFSFHQKRRDLNFINKYFNSTKSQLCFNYNLTVLPFSLGFVVNSQIPEALVLHGCVSLLPFTNLIPYSPKLFFATRFIPKAHFEWISGIRGNYLILVLLFLVMLTLSSVKLFAIVALFLFNSILLGFYSTNEPRVMLNPDSMPVSRFLNQKVLFLLKVIFIINAPVLIINSIFQPDALSFNLSFLLGFMLLGATTIYIKYANYRPSTSLSFSMDFVILTATLALPYLLPLGVYIFFSNKKKAKKNLLIYLDDHS